MAVNSIDAVKRKIKVLQQQADEAEERAQLLQREVEEEKQTREQVAIRKFDAVCQMAWACFLNWLWLRSDFSHAAKA